MTAHYISLSRRTGKELVSIEQVVTRAQSAWQTYEKTGNDFLLDSVALNLHGFYSGIEKLLERFAKGVDNQVPGGNSWHRDLLQQMADDVTGVRPAVISASVLEQLDEYRRFRHVVRNVYGQELEPEKLKVLVTMSFATYTQVEEELVAFSRWLAASG